MRSYIGLTKPDNVIMMLVRISSVFSSLVNICGCEHDYLNKISTANGKAFAQ
jgi:hypothetical protein